MITIHWFRHHHENRNDWIRFGFMQMAKEKSIVYNEWSLNQMLKYGFSKEILNYPDLRHKSFILFENESDSCKCLIDSEDSFALFTELIRYVDQYFCAGYNSEIFLNKRLPTFYQWQTDKDIKWYTEILNSKIKSLADQFYKVKKFIPIAPNLDWPEKKLNKIQRLLYNADDKVRTLLNMPSNYSLFYMSFNQRYNHILSLRKKTLKYDIVLNDTSWGWPEHRIKLHKALANLKTKNFKIHSILKYSEPSICDQSIFDKIDIEQFPIALGKIDNYEEMLASSKIGVYACGFHWGWRNILSLALFIGLPVVTDRLLTQTYFDINEFKLVQTEDENWELLEAQLKHLDEKEWEKIKIHNQAIYDKFLSPKAVANYFINQCLA